MTLVVAVASPKSIWMLTDRRLSFGNGKVRDDARKMMFLETNDGTALLGYSGLGSTGRTEPSEWMVRVLRGRNAPLEVSLGLLKQAVIKHLRPHLSRLEMPGHSIVVAAFRDGQPRIYTIDLLVDKKAKKYQYRFTRHVTQMFEKHGEKAERGVLIAIGGSGAITLLNPRHWVKELRKLIKAHDVGRLPPGVIASYLAGINHKVHLATKDGTVGDRCIVAWRPTAGHTQEYFSGTQPEVQTEMVFMPQVSRGRDMGALLKVLHANAMEGFKIRHKVEIPGLHVVTTACLNEELAKLPEDPGETLE